MKFALAVILMVLAAGSAFAQDAPLGTWSRTGPGTAATAAEDGSATAAIVAGYNFFHATNCIVASDGTTTVVCLVPKEGGSVCSANAAVQNGMLAACQTGNILAFYVPNPATGAFTHLVTFTNK